MAEYDGWIIVADHLTTQQRVALKAELDAQNENHVTVEHQLDDGWSIKKLRRRGDFATEGKLMDNCVGGYGPQSGYHDIYSLRDENDLPYVTFQMRRRTAHDWNTYDAWSRHEVGDEADHRLDTGKDVLSTTQVLGRNNENPKEAYGLHLVKALSGIAKAEGIPNISWNRGEFKTPAHYDAFVKDAEEGGKPQDLYMKVPVGAKTDEGGVAFNRNSVKNIEVSEHEFEPQFGYHVFKTPFSEKRFERAEELQTRLQNFKLPSDEKTAQVANVGKWKVRMKPGTYEPIIEGLKPSQVTMVHQAQTPTHMYVKTSSENWAAAKDACGGGCQGTGYTDPDNHYGERCATCDGSGHGGSEFSFRKATGDSRYSYRTSAHATADLSDFHDDNGQYKDADNVVFKVPFDEQHFQFDPDTGKYGVTMKSPNYKQDDVEMIHKRHLPSHVYVAVPSSERNNRYVYSEQGLEPTFMRNGDAAGVPDRSNFVGAKNNDIIRVDTSKLDDDHLLRHRMDNGSQAQRRRNYYGDRTDFWNLNPRKPIPYEAITDEGGNIDFADKSETNKRKKPVEPKPTDIHDQKLTVKWPEHENPSHVYFTTNVEGRTLDAVKHIEKGNLPKEVGVGGLNDPGDYSRADVRAKVKFDPDLMTDVSPTLKEIRDNGGHINRDGVNRRYDWEKFPNDQQRAYTLNRDIKQGDPNLESVNFSANVKPPEGQQSVIPDEAFLHVPRRLRGNEELYSDKGIDVSKITSEHRGTHRVIEDMSKLWQKPIEGDVDTVNSGENPHESDVWAVDLSKMGHARFEPSGTPYNYYNRDRQNAGHAYDVLGQAPNCTQCNGTGKVNWEENGTHNEGVCGTCEGSGHAGEANMIPWDAIKRLHRKPAEPTAPAIRKFFNVAHVSGWRYLTLLDPR